MSVYEGARRIKTMGRFILYVASGLFVFLVCVLITALIWPSLGIHFAFLEVVILPLLVAVPGAMLLLIGWIVEGFGAKSSGAQPAQDA